MTTPTTPAPKHDRTQARRQRLNEVAQAQGFDTWGKLETAVINGSSITITHPGHTVGVYPLEDTCLTTF